MEAPIRFPIVVVRSLFPTFFEQRRLGDHQHQRPDHQHELDRDAAPPSSSAPGGKRSSGRPDQIPNAARPSYLPPSAQNSLEIVEMNLRRLPVGRRAERNCCGHVTWDGLRLGRRFRSVTDGLNEGIIEGEKERDGY